MSDEKELVYRLMYQSEAIESLTNEDVDEIIATSKKNNTQKNITGFLVFDNGQFIQLLEGEEKAVKDLYENKIKNDPRHKNSRLIREGNGKRMCSHWSMAQLPVGMFTNKVS